MITAPFNFVPLSEKVFFPDWSEDVSHDVPFEDAQSGVIDITITAKSPMFIRDGKNDTEFCSHEGTQYIPGSSVKGMIRNVLEIMSFGKISIDSNKHDKLMSVRDMTNRNELVGTANGCGFLKQDEDGKWIITDYGKPRTIEYSHNKTIENASQDINCDFDTAKEKYENNSTYMQITVEGSIKDLIDRNGKKIGTKKVATIKSGQNNAYIVLTGGIDNKKNEFVFLDSDIVNTITDIDKTVEKFQKVYFETDSVDGNFWKNNWDRDIGIPVFYKKSGSKITDIGLSQLFKLAYNHTINEAIGQQEKSIDVKIKDKDEKDFALDLAQTMFGVIREKANSLKGRVQFSHFKATANAPAYDSITTVLGSPNPSFYPEYIQQNCQDDGKVENDNYNTLMNKNSKIAGWKRYPLRYGKPKYKKADEGTDSATSFTPIGTYRGDNFNEFTFKGKVRFHNLKRVEVGALLSALTFHNNQENFYHNIGMAKSLGFGKIKISIDLEPYKQQLVEYEILMRNWTKDSIDKEWIETEQLQELFAMAYKNLNIDGKLKYLTLDPDRRINEFSDAKNERIRGSHVGRDCLPKVSKLFDMRENYPESLLTKELLEEMEIQKNKQKEEEVFNKKLQEAKSTDNVQIIKNFIANYATYGAIGELEERVKNIEVLQNENKHSIVDQKVKSAWEALQKKKGNQKQYKKELDKFIKKWNAEKNHKNSRLVLDYVEKAKKS